MIKNYKCIKSFIVDVLNEYGEINGKLNISENTIYEHDERWDASEFLGIRLRNEDRAFRIGKNCFKEYFEEVIENE